MCVASELRVLSTDTVKPGFTGMLSAQGEWNQFRVRTCSKFLSDFNQFGALVSVDCIFWWKISARKCEVTNLCVLCAFQAECPPSQKDQVEPVDLSVNKSSVGRGEPVLLQVPRYNPLLSVASSRSSPPGLHVAPEPSDLSSSAEDIKKEQGQFGASFANVSSLGRALANFSHCSRRARAAVSRARRRVFAVAQKLLFSLWGETGVGVGTPIATIQFLLAALSLSSGIAQRNIFVYLSIMVHRKKLLRNSSVFASWEQIIT
jgi:hypothetical protein